MKDVLLAILSGIICAAVALSVVFFDVVKAVVQDVVRGEIILENEEDLYYYNQLGEKEKKAYKKIVDKVGEFPEEIRIPYLENDSLVKVLGSISYDQPDLFYFKASGQEIKRRNCYYLVMDYAYDKATYTEYKEKIDSKIEEIVSQIDDDWNDYEKELFVHDYIVSHCTYYKDDSVETYKAYGALVNGYATCEGYSRALQMVLDRIGIKTFLVSGNVIDANDKMQGHTWNVVEINGKHYYVDVTGDDQFGQDLYDPSHVFFNLSFDDMLASHIFKNDHDDFDCKDTSQNYFIKNGLYFTACDKNTVNIVESKFKEAISNGKDRVEFKFANPDILKEAKESMLTNEDISKLLLNAMSAYPDAKVRKDFKKVINEKHNTVIILLSYER